MSSVFGSEPAQQAQQTVQRGVGMGRAAGDVEIDGKEIADSVVRLGAAAKRAAADGAGAGGDHQLRGWNGGIGVEKGRFHVLGHRPGDQDAVGMARRGDELDAEAAEIEDQGGKDIDVGLAGAASAGGDLAQLEGTPVGRWGTPVGGTPVGRC